ncbi:MAG: hypothetical protein ACT4OJ_07065 [Bacteroidota bacterium]
MPNEALEKVGAQLYNPGEAAVAELAHNEVKDSFHRPYPCSSFA